MSKTVGFGLVGCGMIAAHHARAIAASRGGHLVAAHSRERERAEKFAREFGAQVAESLEALVENPAVDVVVVTTASGAHLEPALAAAAAGKHVLVEKPLEISVERVDRMIAACTQARVHLAAVCQARFGRGARKVKEAVAAGRAWAGWRFATRPSNGTGPRPTTTRAAGVARAGEMAAAP